MKIAPGAAFDIAVSSTVNDSNAVIRSCLSVSCPIDTQVSVCTASAPSTASATRRNCATDSGAEERQPLELGVVGVVAGRAREAQVHRRQRAHLAE